MKKIVLSAFVLIFLFSAFNVSLDGFQSIPSAVATLSAQPTSNSEQITDLAETAPLEEESQDGDNEDFGLLCSAKDILLFLPISLKFFYSSSQLILSPVLSGLEKPPRAIFCA